MTTSSTIETADSTNRPNRQGHHWIIGFMLLGMLCVACDGGGRTPTGPSPPDFSAGFSRSVTQVSGNGQQGRINEPLDRPLVVRVTDSHGQPEADTTVLFRVLEGDGKIPGERVLIDGEPGEATTALTDGAGLATVSLVLGPQPGLNLVEVKVFFGGSDPVLFSASAVQ